MSVSAICPVLFAGILALLLSIAVYDIRFRKIRRRQLLGVFILSLCCCLTAGRFSLAQCAGSAAAAILPGTLLNLRKKCFGRGDLLLLLACSPLLSAPEILRAQGTAIVLAAAAILTGLIRRLLAGRFSLENLKGAIPMAPFLCGGVCITLTARLAPFISSSL